MMLVWLGLTLLFSFLIKVSFSQETLVYFSFYIISGFILLNLADIHSTYCFTSVGCQEGNVLARWFFKKFNVIPGCFIFKTILIFLCWLLGVFSPEFLDLLLALDMTLAIIVVRNYFIYFEEK